MGSLSCCPKSNQLLISKFRPICLLNVIYKIITKTLTLRLTAVINKVISPFQTSFIPRRNILEGVVILQEVLHELRSKNLREFLSS
jgi:hypothetical protein